MTCLGVNVGLCRCVRSSRKWHNMTKQDKARQDKARHNKAYSGILTLYYSAPLYFITFYAALYRLLTFHVLKLMSYFVVQFVPKYRSRSEASVQVSWQSQFYGGALLAQPPSWKIYFARMYSCKVTQLQRHRQNILQI